MQEKIITDILREAIRIEGSAQALASRLNAPEGTLARWVAGRAQTPLRAFLAVIDFVMKHEAGAPPSPGAPAAADDAPPSLVLALGPLEARCARCDGTRFKRLGAAPLQLTSVLACCECGTQVVHGNLLAQLARDAVQQSRASMARAQRAVSVSRASIERAREGVAKSAERLKRGGEDS